MLDALARWVYSQALRLMTPATKLMTGKQAVVLPRAGIVHRLDKDTSGLMVVAKTLPAMTALSRDIAARTVQRRYLAIASGAMAMSIEWAAMNLPKSAGAFGKAVTPSSASAWCKRSFVASSFLPLAR